MMSPVFLLSTLLFSIAFGQPPPGATIYVNINAANGGDGKSWQTSFNDLQMALSVVKDGSPVWIAQGTYYPSSSTNRNATFLIEYRLSIYGGFKGDETSINERPNPLLPTILSGNIGDKSSSSDNSYHVLMLTTDHSVFDGLIISDGMATDDSYSDYKSCSSCFGGGLWIPCDETHPVNVNINQCTFKSNIALSGGGIHGMCQPYFDITNSKFEGNKAIFGEYKGGYGGGFMFAYMGDINISNTTFTNNIADGGGGGAHCDYGMICAFDDCTFNGNMVNKGNGAAISMIDRDSQRGFSNLAIATSTFTNNIAGVTKSTIGGYGGAVYLFDNDVHGIINDSVFTSNTANYGGAASFNGQAHCDDCCDPTISGNTFNSNSANNDNDCYMHGFTQYQNAPETSNPSQYLELLNNQKEKFQPPNEPPVSAHTVHVSASAASGGDGTSWSSAFNDLQDGLTAAEKILNGAKTTVEIWVTGSSNYGTHKYLPSVVPTWYNTSAHYYNPQKSKMFEIMANINLFGGFAGTETERTARDWYKNPTLLDGWVTASAQVYQVVYVHENCWIDGFMIANGYAMPGPPPSTQQPRQLLNRMHHHHRGNDHHKKEFKFNKKDDKYGRNQLIQQLMANNKNNVGQTNPNQVLFDQTPVRGSAIFSNVSSFGIANVLMYSNYGTKGALYILGNPNFTHNITGYNLGFVNNYAIDRGGGLAIDLYGEMNCIGCIFMNNICSHKGGAVYSDFWGHNMFDQCLFYNNTAEDSGGAFGMDAGYSSVSNSNFTKNFAFSQGAGLYTGSYNPDGGGDYELANHFFLNNNYYSDDNVCASGLVNHYLWTYDYWVDTANSKSL